MQGLRTLQLVAKKTAAVEHCIPKIQKQKWPTEIIICTKAVPGAGSLLVSSAFPNLSVLHSFADKKIPFHDSLRAKLFPSLELKVQGKCSSNSNAMMLCLIINCVSPHMELVIKEDDPMHNMEDDLSSPFYNREDDLSSPIYKREYNPSSPFYRWEDDPIYILSSTEMEEGNWIWIGTFTQYSRFLTAPKYSIVDRRNSRDGMFRRRSKVEKGLLVMGEEINVVEAFHRIVKLLGN